MIGAPDTPNTPPRGGGRSRNGRIIAGIAAALVVAGIGGPAAVQAVQGAVPAPAEHRHEIAAPDASLDDVTLGDLAGQLGELGLAVEIVPASGRDTGPASDEETTIEDPSTDSDDAEAPIGTFTVDGDRIDTTGAPRHVADDARAIWERFVALIPADQRQMVVGFELLDESFGGAYVYPTDEDPTKWVLAVARGLGDDVDGVLIHEFGHLLTLQAREVPPGDNADACSTYFTGEGCALSGSTFARFVERFWPPAMVDEVDAIQETGDWDAADSFWERHETDFVTDYATTNPGEDLAETFTVFVMGEHPTGDTVADQKVLFLWDDPAMTALRDQIRTHLTAASVPVG